MKKTPWCMCKQGSIINVFQYSPGKTEFASQKHASVNFLVKQVDRTVLIDAILHSFLLKSIDGDVHARPVGDIFSEHIST